MAIKTATYECNWCEYSAGYNGEQVENDEPAQDGWIVLDKYPEKGLTFCCEDCLQSYL